MQSTLKLQNLSFSNYKTYIAAAAFIIGNLALPQLFHLVPQGGIIWLPIYFFTLVAAYKFGWRVGVLTAVASPVLNSVLFGMPMPAVLPAILIKSVLLAIVAGYAAYRFKKATLIILAGVILTYQAIGTLAEWAIIGDFAKACQDFRLGIPGMLLQIVGGWFLINLPLKAAK